MSGGSGPALARWRPRERERLSIGLCVPIGGSAGLWGPSAIACAELAAEEINCDGGADGRELRLTVFNAADEADDLLPQTRAAIDSGEIDAIVGMHTSSVRQRVERATLGRVPFVYTPLYEGGADAPGVFAIGERPEQQLRPALHAMCRRYRARRWLLLGNDYVWPRVSHRLARAYLHEAGAEVLDDVYLPFGACSPGADNDLDAVFDRLRRLAPDALLLSLIGQDTIDFNRRFGELGLARRMLRLSCAIEENTLLAIGANNSGGLHVAAGYFASLAHDANQSFKERYHGRFGARAPMLNTLGQSTYEGVHFAAALVQQGLARGRSRGGPAGQMLNQTLNQTLDAPLAWRSVRGTRYLDNRRSEQPVFLARASGHLFEVVQAL